MRLPAVCLFQGGSVWVPGVSRSSRILLHFDLLPHEQTCYARTQHNIVHLLVAVVRFAVAVYFSFSRTFAFVLPLFGHVVVSLFGDTSKPKSLITYE